MPLEPVGHPWQYKIEDIGNTQEGEKLDINKLAPSVIYHHFSSNFILHSYKVSYIIQKYKRKFFGAG